MTDIVHVRLSKLPSSIKSTQFYNLLKNKHIKKDSDVKIPIPADIYAKELIMSTVYDMIPAVDSLFKLTGEIDEKNYDFIYENRASILPHVQNFKVMYQDNIFVNEITLLLENSGSLLFEIIENDYVNLLKYCISKELLFINYDDICVVLAKKGKYQCLKYMHSIGATLDKRSLDIAIKNKCEECVNYILFYTDVE